MKVDFKKRGFTLVETLVAIAIFAFSITALISITANGVFNTNFVKNKFTAGYLALEGAELVRSIRDTSSTAGNDWNSIMNGVLADCQPGQFCYIDAGTGPDSINVFPCNADCPYLNFRESNGRFSYDPYDGFDNLISIFRRIIYIEPVNDHEVKVISRVEWNQGTNLRSVEYSYNLMNWTGN